MRGLQQTYNDEADTLDEFVPLTGAKFPGNPHLATRWRWALQGLKRGDDRIKLRTLKSGGRTFTTQRWANEFVAACNADNPAPREATDADALRRAREAGKALEALGA